MSYSILFILTIILSPQYLALLFLPSFPTRRSSDLLPFIATSTSQPRFRRVIAPTIWLVTLSSTRRDRKSTRLNSSHLVISYAVFCLKKKNKTLILIEINKLTAQDY